MKSSEGKDKSWKQEQRRATKNVLILGLGFLLVYMAFFGLARLQSTLHHEEGMGVINQGVIYGVMLLSSSLTPRLVISLLGQKWTVTLCMIGYLVWMAANGYPVWGTMTPASVLVGVCGGPLWAAQSSYVAKMARRYAAISDTDENSIMARFFGIFFTFYQSSSVLGAIVAFTVLSQKQVSPTANTTVLVLMHSNSTTYNHTFDLGLDPDHNSDLAVSCTCGANDCPWCSQTNDNLAKPESRLVWTLVGVYLAMACAGFLVLLIFLDKLPPDLQDRVEMKDLGSQTVKLLKATLAQLKHRRQLLLLPLTIYSGLEQSYYNAEFTKSFVGCSLGLHMVGLVLFPAFIVSGITCVFSGFLVKHTGRVPIFCIAWCVDIGNHITMMLWTPDPGRLYIFFIMACCWGFTEGIWQAQINGLYGVAFKDESEAAFASYRLWDCCGCILGYGWSHFLCTKYKTYILSFALCLGMFGYFLVEWLIWRAQKSQRRQNYDVDIKAHQEVNNKLL